MKKTTLLILVLALVIIPSFALAQVSDDVEINFTEKNQDAYYVGHDASFKIRVSLKSPPSGFRSLILTADLSEGFDYESARLISDVMGPASLNVNVNLDQNGNKRYVNLAIFNLDKYPNLSEFEIELNGKINEKKQDGQNLNTRIVGSYQLKGNDKADIIPEKIYKSQKTVSRQSPTSPNTSNLEINMHTGNVYAEFMNRIQGYTEPNTDITVTFADHTITPQVSSNGFFTFNIPEGTKDTIRISGKNKSTKATGSISMRFVDHSQLKQEDLDYIVMTHDKIGSRNIARETIQNYRSENTLQELAFGEDFAPISYEILKAIYDQTLVDVSSVVDHKAFMGGYPGESNFKPNNPITRAEVSTILSRVIHGGEIGSRRSSFKDVEDFRWYSKYVGHMESEGLLSGYPDGSFKPGANITRAELASIIARLNNLNDTSDISYPDIKKDSWVNDPVTKVVNAGIMTGYPDGTFGPNNMVTRAEAATIINRARGRNADKNFIDSNNVSKFTDIKNHWAYYEIIEATYDHKALIQDGKEIYQ